MTEPDPGPAPIASWLAEPLAPAVERSLLRLARAPGVRRVAVMPDVHLAEEVCVGVVLATEGVIYPSAVGGDLGCGMAAIAFEAEAEAIRDERHAARLLSALHAHLPAIKHRVADAPELPEELARAPLSDPRLERLKQREARLELGTLGRGNHFLEFQADQEGRLWLMLHSGSRAVGPTIRDHHLARARARGSPGALIALEAESEAGRAYLQDHRFALRYAELSRRFMIDRACELAARLLALEADPASFFDCAHNSVAKESHLGTSLWVHRKGALAAHAGARGMIPGSIGSASYHVSGRGHEPALCSSSHGAGRRLSRSEARQRVTIESLERELAGVLLDHRRLDALRDEAPSAYRAIERVMRAQRELVRIERRLTPVLSYKG